MRLNIFRTIILFFILFLFISCSYTRKTLEELKQPLITINSVDSNIAIFNYGEFCINKINIYDSSIVVKSHFNKDKCKNTKMISLHPYGQFIALLEGDLKKKNFNINIIKTSDSNEIISIKTNHPQFDSFDAERKLEFEPYIADLYPDNIPSVTFDRQKLEPKVKFNNNVNNGFIKNPSSFKLLDYINYLEESFDFQWSLLNESFYIIRNDSIMNVMFNGTCQHIIYYPKIDCFSISHLEKQFLIYHEDQIILYNIINKKVTTIANMDKGLNIFHKTLKRISWLSDDSKVAFAIGWTIYIYDIYKQELNTIKLKGEVFDIAWLNSESLVYIQGEYPSMVSQMQSDKRFEIRKINLLDNTNITLYARLDHHPFIRLKVSPSGELIMFHEKDKKLDWIKIITSDGIYAKRLSFGFQSQWIIK